MKTDKFQSVRGVKDILPAEKQLHRAISDTFELVATSAGYGEIETPIIEKTEVFTRATPAADIVQKELYVFKDRSGNEISLRPEGTAGVVRAYIENGMSSLPQPVRLLYEGPMFRYDRPQKGRQRQFTQVGVEYFGEAGPSADAQVILMANRFYRHLGLTNLSLQINSIGDEACRPKFEKELATYLKKHKDTLCKDCAARLKSGNALRVLDCKEKSCQPVIASAPQILNFLCKDCHEHMAGVLEYLDDLGVEYELNAQLVRGLDYYNRTVFEYFGRRAGAQSSLGAGGRYDGLVELMGGPQTPAVGFALGVERIMMELQEEDITPHPTNRVKAYVACLGEPARLISFRVTEQLLDAGIGAVSGVDKNNIGAQLKRADKLKVPYAIIIGQKEVFDNTVLIRDMESGVQEVVPLERVVVEIQKKVGEEA